MSFKGLKIGVSGLEAQSKKMEVVGNNLANLNTVGYKTERVTFQETFADLFRAGSAGNGDTLGGTNPMAIGGGVEVGSIDRLYSQGTRIQTSRTLDFMIEGEDFFAVQNAANGSIMLTRNGNFQLDGDRNLVDSMGNMVYGFNVERETGVIDDIAQKVNIPDGAIDPNATSQINLKNNIDAAATENLADGSTNAWEVFAGGENFGNMKIAVDGQTGTRDVYGSGYYQEAILYRDAAATLNVGLATVDINVAPTNLVDGFAIGDTISLFDGTNQVQRTITGVAGQTLTLDTALVAPFAAGAIEVTNMTDATASLGTSGAAAIHQDILNNQVAMIDDNGNLIASFYRVDGPAKEYTRAVATDTALASVVIGTGEFTNISELKDNIVRALRDNQLTNYAASTNLDVSMDEFGAISFGGTGLVQSFRLVMNADNTEMLDRFNGIAMTDAAAVATTQARLDANNQIIAGPALGLGARAVNGSKAWYATTGLETYGFNSTNTSTEYGHHAGLRLDGGANGTGFGVVQLSLTNALGAAQTTEYRLVPRNADASAGEFSSMEDLARLIEGTLKSQSFSSIATNGVLVADTSVSANFSNGRLSVSTSSGIFNNLVIGPANTTGDVANGISLSDQATFGTVLGEFTSGINGKSGVSNKFIEADNTILTRVFDSQGNEHTVSSYLVRDRSESLSNIEWKYQLGLQPNLNTFSEENTSDSDTYINTYNSRENLTLSRGVIGFDSDTGEVLGSGVSGASGDPRYVQEGQIEFQPQLGSIEAGEMSIAIDFSELTSFNGNNTAIGQNIDGFGMGQLVRLASEQNTGKVNGVYSNGQIRTLAKIGLMNISNPAGLEKVGSSYFVQSTNSDTDTKGIDQIFSVVSDDGESTGDVSSRIHGNALEASNVELTNELTEMISTQRTYSASGKIITTSDDMLQEALNLKR